jgi:signal transduction histidine kinase
MVATLFVVLAEPGTDIAKSLAVTLVVVSALVAARQTLQVLVNRRLVAETAALLKLSRENEAKIAHLSKTKSEVMSNLSHEFRNALVGIQGFSEIMRNEDLPPEQVKEFAADIFDDSNRLTRMINEMLDLDRMESGRVTLDLKPLDLNVLVEQAVDRAKVSGAKCKIISRLETPLPVVDGDSDRLFQVISNLLGNAVKYSPDGGEVLVTTSHTDGDVRISVKDHGVGIAPEDLPRLFQRYERIDNKSGHKISGTGLGLVIARQIVEMHGGRIWAGRNEEGGSEFAFAIPTSARQAPSTDANPSITKAA